MSLFDNLLEDQDTQKVKLRTMRAYHDVPTYTYEGTIINYVNALRAPIYTYTGTVSNYRNTLINI